MPVGIDPLSTRFRRKIRDPIFCYIPITRIENRIIDSPPFQRLDRLLQMSTAHMVYPSAKYTRKAHSLGVMHIAHKAFCSILYRQHKGIKEKIPQLLYKQAVPLPEEEEELDALDQHWDFDSTENERNVEWVIQCLRIAALLHDVGHAPLCHLFEDICKEFDHEEMSRKVVMDVYLKELGILDDRTAKFVSAIISGKKLNPDYRFLYELVNGPLDCDKMDYLVRDGYHAGTPEFGYVDVARIVDGLRVKSGRLCVDESELEAVMDGFHALFYMYASVYYHKTSRMFELQMGDALRPVMHMLKEIATSLEKLLKYDDYSLINKIMHEAENESNTNQGKFSEAATLLQDVLDRKKRYKAIAREKLDLNMYWLGSSDSETDLGKELENMSDIIRAEGKGLRLKIDTRPKIRSIGVKFDKVLEWLEKKVILRNGGRESVRLRDVGMPEVTVLSRIYIPVTVFCDVSHLTDPIEPKVNDQIEKIEVKLKELVNEMRKKYAFEQMKKFGFI